MTTRDFYRIGSVLSLAFVLGGAAAKAQVGGTAPSGQVRSPASGTSKGDLSRPDDDGEERSDLNAKKAPAPPPARMSTFNRVTTTRKEVVPAQSQAARVARPGGTSTGAAAASRAGVLHPYTKPANARAKMANSGVPNGSTARQEPRQSTRPATAVRSATHNYYPTLRPGAHVNANKAQVAAASKGRNSAQLGAGVGMGLGMGMAGSNAAQMARPGSSPTRATGGSSAQSSPRR